MWRILLLAALLIGSFPRLQDLIIQESIVAMIDQAKHEFTRDPVEIDSLIQELDQKPELDVFEKILLEELKKFHDELIRYPHLAKGRAGSS